MVRQRLGILEDRGEGENLESFFVFHVEEEAAWHMA